MKKTALVLAICALTLFILLPVVSPVNISTSGTPLTDRVLYKYINTTLMADGEPLPPPIPPHPSFSEMNPLVADGEPLPPPIPPNPKFSETNLLVADGEPLPPPIPPKPSLNMMFV